MQVETNNNSEKETFIKKAKGFIKELNELLNDKESKSLISAVKFVFKSVIPNPKYKFWGDITISLICIGSVIYCAHCGFIEKANVQSLLSLIVGALIGARFKSS